MLSPLDGMGAFLRWDGRRRTLVASRDRFGVKPLYSAMIDGVWVFASEIKALLAYPGASMLIFFSSSPNVCGVKWAESSASDC